MSLLTCLSLLIGCGTSSENAALTFASSPFDASTSTAIAPFENKVSSVDGTKYRAYWATSRQSNSFGPANLQYGVSTFEFTGPDTMQIVDSSGRTNRYIFASEMVGADGELIAEFLNDPENFVEFFPDPEDRPNEILRIYSYLPFNHTGNLRDTRGNIASFLFGDVEEFVSPPPQNPAISSLVNFVIPYTELHLMRGGTVLPILVGTGTMSVDFSNGTVAGEFFSNAGRAGLNAEVSFIGGAIDGQDFHSMTSLNLTDTFDPTLGVKNHSGEVLGHLTGGGMGAVAGFGGTIETLSSGGEENWSYGGTFHAEYQ